MNKPVARWANTEPDAGAPHALLERLAQRVPVESIEEIWLFPTRRIAIGESTVFVVAALGDDPERRLVITARYAVTRDKKGVATVQEKIDEHGIAPAAAVSRIVQGVLRRMGEEGEQQPRAERIEHDPERWWPLVEELGGRRPQPAEPEQAPVADLPSDAATLQPAPEPEGSSEPAITTVEPEPAPEPDRVAPDGPTD